MAAHSVFKRFEMKYLLSAQQRDLVLQVMAPYMKLDQYGRSAVRNIYFDTQDYLLIRRSIDRPIYKEKLRIRSYTTAQPDTTVFVELKKKYDRVVYKRRTSLTEAEAMDWLCGGKPCVKPNQISAEVDYFMDYYKTLHPTAFISYHREAYYAKDGSDFRVTFDDDILCRLDDLSLRADAYGTPLLPEGKVLMEIKGTGGMPLWMAHFLSEQHIFKTSFSKYGTAYQKMIFPKIQNADTVRSQEVSINA